MRRLHLISGIMLYRLSTLTVDKNCSSFLPFTKAPRIYHRNHHIIHTPCYHIISLTIHVCRNAIKEHVITYYECAYTSNEFESVKIL